MNQLHLVFILSQIAAQFYPTRPHIAAGASSARLQLTPRATI
jgi:hypothetical protein